MIQAGFTLPFLCLSHLSAGITDLHHYTWLALLLIIDFLIFSSDAGDGTRALHFQGTSSARAKRHAPRCSCWPWTYDSPTFVSVSFPTCTTTLVSFLFFNKINNGKSNLCALKGARATLRNLRNVHVSNERTLLLPGLIGKVTLQIPFYRPHVDPWVISISGLHVIGAPEKIQDFNDEKEKLLEREHKKALLQALEERWKARPCALGAPVTSPTVKHWSLLTRALSFAE